MGQQAIDSTRLGDELVDRDDVTRTVSATEDGLEVRLVDTIHAVSEDRWNAVVDRATCSTVFHRYEWVSAIEAGLEYTPAHLVVEKDGNTIGVCPNFVLDLPKTPFRRLTSIYPGFGGPLVTTDVKDALSLVIEAIPDLCDRGTIVHEIRTCNPEYLRYSDVVRSRGYRPAQMGCRFVLRLDKGYDDILAEMSSSRRTGIRRGRETDHEIVEEEATRANLERFYQVYERHMDRVGGETYPLSFFESLLAMKSRLLLVTIRINGEYAGGFLELLDDEQSAVHGFFAAVPADYFDDHASELLYDYVIRWGIEHGYETYDFGGGHSDFEDGVFRFKEGFGGELVPNLHWERGCSPTWKLAKVGRSLHWRYNK